MIRLSIPSAMICFVMLACGPENPEMQNAEQVTDRSEQVIVTEKPSDALYANAIKEDDLAGRVRWSLGLLQEELNKSAGTVTGLGKVSVLLDENLLMVVRNEFEGDIYEQKVNVANLDPDLKSVRIIVDGGEEPFPGMKLAVLDGKPGVDVLVNGNKKSTERYLELKFAERSQVQHVLSAMRQAIQSVHGEI